MSDVAAVEVKNLVKDFKGSLWIDRAERFGKVDDDEGGAGSGGADIRNVCHFWAKFDEGGFSE
jgi:hypothetical protein